MTEPPDLTAKEVAALLRLNVGTVKKLCRDGDLPGAYKTTASPQGNWRIPHAAITAYRTARQENQPKPTRKDNHEHRLRHAVQPRQQ